MNASNLARTTFVLSRSIHDDLNYLAERTDQSRSAIVREVLEPSIAEMARIMRTIPDQPTPDDLVRFTGEARQFFDSVHQEGVELFKGLK